MIKFKDYPDTTTPLDAEKLNANFNELNNRVISNGISDTNADDYMYSGMYYLTTGCSNVPTSFIKLFVNGDGGNDVVQIAVQNESVPDMWIRTKTSGDWKPWRLLARGYIGGVAPGSDFNSFTYQATLQYGGQAGILNAPPGLGILEVIVTGDYIIQRVTSSGHIYIRMHYDNTWTTWKKSTLT